MSELKKTLRQGTPATIHPIVTPKGTAEEPSQLPPAPSSEELAKTKPPEGRRTPDARTPAAGLITPLPENATGWMLRARRMSIALEEAIAVGQADATLEAAIERAFAAWELDGSRDKRIARVASLVEQAHTAIRETKASDLDRAYNECAQVLWAGLPRSVRAKQEFSRVLLVVRALREEADPWAAVVTAAAALLGWVDAARAHAAHAVRVAILAERERRVEDPAR